jgi:hypothetical protein
VTTPRLQRDVLDRIIRRAVELQFQAGEEGVDSGDGLTEEEILRIGGEVGLDPVYLRRAMGEARAAALTPPTPEEVSLLRRLYGPGVVTATRTVRGDPEHLAPRIHEWLRKRESLSSIRERTGHSMWEPNASWNAQMERAFRRRGHAYDLARFQSLEVILTPLESGWTAVTLRADASNVRGEHALGWGLPFLLGSAIPTWVILGAVMGVPVPLAFLAGAGTGALGVGATLPLARGTVRGALGRLSLALEGFLDRVERDDLTSGKSENPISEFLGRL